MRRSPKRFVTSGAEACAEENLICWALVNTSPVTTGCRKSAANMCSNSAALCSFFSHSFSSAISASRSPLLVRVSSPATDNAHETTVAAATVHHRYFITDSALLCHEKRLSHRCVSKRHKATKHPNQLASYSISAVIVPLTSFNVTVSTPASFTLSNVTESPSSSTRLRSQVPDFASFLKRTLTFPPATSTLPSSRRFASQSLLSEAVI